MLVPPRQSPVSSGSNKTSRNQAFDSYILLGSAPQPAKAARTATASTETPAVQEELGCEKKRVARCCGAKKKGRWRARQPVTLCDRCKAARKLSELQQACVPCIRRGEAEDCVAWDRLRALASKIHTPAEEDSMALVPRPLPQSFGVPNLRPGSMIPGSGVDAFHNALKNVTVQRNGLHPGKLDGLMSALTPRIQAQILKVAKCVDIFPHCAYGRELHRPDGLSELQINYGFSAMAGCHVEELCARLAAGDIKNAPFPEMDHLGMTIDIFSWVAQLDPNKTAQVDRYVRFSAGVLGKEEGELGHGQMVRVCIRYAPVEWDENGELSFSIERFLVPITPAEYDLAVVLTPHLCRPLLTAAGDRRTALQLLADHPYERHKGLHGLTQEAEGRERLEALSDVIDSTVLPSLERLSLSGASSPAPPSPPSSPTDVLALLSPCRVTTTPPPDSTGLHQHLPRQSADAQHSAAGGHLQSADLSLGHGVTAQQVINAVLHQDCPSSRHTHNNAPAQHLSATASVQPSMSTQQMVNAVLHQDCPHSVHTRHNAAALAGTVGAGASEGQEGSPEAGRLSGEQEESAHQAADAAAGSGASESTPGWQQQREASPWDDEHGLVEEGWGEDAEDLVGAFLGSAEVEPSASPLEEGGSFLLESLGRESPSPSLLMSPRAEELYL